jgi:hypothetical protein
MARKLTLRFGADEDDVKTAKRIIEAVESEYGYKRGGLEARMADMAGSRGQADEAKQAACVLMRLHTKLGWRNMGTIFYDRTASPIRVSTESAMKRAADPMFVRRLRDIEKTLGLRSRVGELVA